MDVYVYTVYIVCACMCLLYVCILYLCTVWFVCVCVCVCVCVWCEDMFTVCVSSLYGRRVRVICNHSTLVHCTVQYNMSLMRSVPPLHAVLRRLFLVAIVPHLTLVTGTAPPPPTPPRCNRGILDYWITPTFQGRCYLLHLPVCISIYIFMYSL